MAIVGVVFVFSAFHYFKFDLVTFSISLLSLFYVSLCGLAITPFLIYFLSRFEIRNGHFRWLMGFALGGRHLLLKKKKILEEKARY